VDTKFKFLGTIINSKNNMTETIQDRIQAGNKAYYANQMMLKNRYINRGAKMQIYKTLIRPLWHMAVNPGPWKKRTEIFYEDLRGKLSEEFTAQWDKGGNGG
jgi:hypothetical protein